MTIDFFSYSNMTSFTKMLPLKPSLALTLKAISIDSVDHFNLANDATDNLTKFLKSPNVLEQIYIRAVIPRSFINEVLGSVESKKSKVGYFKFSKA